ATVTAPRYPEHVAGALRVERFWRAVGGPVSGETKALLSEPRQGRVQRLPRSMARQGRSDAVGPRRQAHPQSPAAASLRTPSAAVRTGSGRARGRGGGIAGEAILEGRRRGSERGNKGAAV